MRTVSKMMNIRWAAAAILVLALLLGSVSYADHNEYIPAAPIHFSDKQIRHVQHIYFVRHSGKSAYYGLLTCDAKDGSELNIDVKNNGASKVRFNVQYNGIDMETVDVPSRDSKTRNFKEMLGKGLSGDFKIYVYTKDGSILDLEVSAEQF